MAFRITHVHQHYPVMFRAEWVAEVDLDACNGCKNCIRQCQFGAMRFSAVDEKVTIDPRQCYGCGVCRSACQRNAISLHAREENPITADIW
jgi:heterodisulfide reductase subunit A-like polyferredoxin